MARRATFIDTKNHMYRMKVGFDLATCSGAGMRVPHPMCDLARCRIDSDDWVVARQNQNLSARPRLDGQDQ
jgi:hypothetical protein